MKSSYITSASKTGGRRQPAVVVFASIFLAILIGFGGLFSATSKTDRNAEAFDPIQWAMCYFGKDSVPGMVYQNVQSSDMQFALRSKSSITVGVNNVDSGLNWILDMFGPGFKKVNEQITGYDLDPFDPKVEADQTPAKERFNQGAKVNPFDRFGVAGLNFTSYTGEWKHVVIDACSTADSEPQDPKAGTFYEDRLEPRSTWEDIGNSKDIRTLQFNKGFSTQFGASFADLFANMVFTITKTMVVFTIALINFAFSDIVEIIGLNDLIAGGPGGGLFGALFQGIFMPLIVIVFAITGFHILWKALVKKEYRSSMTDLLRAIALFVIAIIIAASPMAFITLPNKVAVVGQSIILTSMNSGLAGGNGLCSTDIGQFKTKLVSDSLASDPNAKSQDILTQASESMRSAIGCQLWQTFLFKPWAEGQFGVGWEKTWAKGKIPEWTNQKTAKEFKNENESMVGDAAVPMGGGSIINNWALFQISVQTNAHSPIGHEGEKSKYTSGIANDWWRIVDTLSNYQEEEKTEKAIGTGQYGAKTGEDSVVKYTAAKEAPALAEWDTWVGNTASSRFWTAISSVIIALIGLAAPLFFSFLSAVYSIGVAILMIFAPIMLLVGCWSGRGWEMFKGWGEMVVNTTLKRIATGALLAITIGLEIAAIQMMDTIGWWQGILMLILVSVIIIKSRHKIIDALASVRFSSMSLSGTANKLNNKTMGFVKGTGKAAMNTTAATIGSKRYGGTLKDGFNAGIRNELKNASYKSRRLREAITSYEEHNSGADHEGDTLRGQETCFHCGKRIDYEEDQHGLGLVHGGRTIDGNAVCFECMDSGVDPDDREVIFKRPDVTEREDVILNKQQDKLRKSRFTNKTAFGNTVSKGIIDRIENKVDSKGNPLNNESNTKQLAALLKSVNYDIRNHKLENGMPSIPTEIKDHINHEILETAWNTGNHQWIHQAYTIAWATWFTEVTGEAINGSLEELLAGVEADARGKDKNSNNSNNE